MIYNLRTSLVATHVRANRITMEDLENIKQKINIVDLIQEYIPLKKAGVNFKANCPFHGEKTPSFIVSPERQIWKCFGCQRGGDHFKFLMEKEGMEFKEALEFLAKKAGIILKKVEGKKDFRDRLFEVNLKAQEFFHFILTKHPLGKNALNYLKKRGLSNESIKEFGIGYAPNSWDSLLKFLSKRGFYVKEIIDSGLGVESKFSGYDRFRGRITFPLIDTKGRVIGFSGRVLYLGEPKYINTPQTIIFDKSQFLFGINLAKGIIRSKDEAILVEGEMDVVMSHQVGIKNAVASKGTALTEGQIDLLKKYTQNLSLCFDTDLAGDAASRRGIEMADKAGFNIKVITITGGKDPAEVAKINPDLWEKAVSSSIPIYDYYLESVSSRYNPKKSEDLRKIAHELVPIWAKINDDLVREHYTQKLTALLRTDEVVLRQTINKERRGVNTSYQILSSSKKDDSVMSSRTRRSLLEEYLIALLLHIPKDITYVPPFPETLLTTENWKQIFVLLVLYLDSISFKGRVFDINEFIKTLSKELSIEVDRLYLTEIDEKLFSKEAWQKELDGVISELKKALVKASLEKLSYEIKNAQEFGKMEALDSLNKRFRDLSVKLKNL